MLAWGDRKSRSLHRAKKANGSFLKRGQIEDRHAVESGTAEVPSWWDSQNVVAKYQSIDAA